MAINPEYIRPSGAKIEETFYDIDAYEQDLREHDRLTYVTAEAVDKARRLRAANNIMFYVAGALTGVSEPAKARYVAISDTIFLHGREPGNTMSGYVPHLHGTDPRRHPDVTPNEVRDIDYLFSAIIPDAHINVLDPVAHGNAIEEGWAESKGIPSLYVVREDVTLSRLIRGMRNVIDTIVYRDFQQDALPQIGTFLDQL